MRCLLGLTAIVVAISPLFSDEVGSFGDLFRIRIEGATAFAPEQILKALEYDSVLLGPRHPQADLDEFLGVLSRRVRSGYRFGGFPDAHVSASLESTDGHRFVVLRVREGPRFRAGQVVVVESPALNPAQVRQSLIVPRDRGTGLPSAEPLASSQQWPPIWKPDEMVRFDNAWQAQARSLLEHLHVDAGFHGIEPELEYVRRDGVVDLRVTIGGEWCRPTIRRVEIQGAVRNDPEAIRSWLSEECGVEAGGVAREDRVRLMREKLHATGCFLEERAILVPVGEQMDLVLGVVESDSLPRLGAPLSDRQQLFFKMREWLESLLAGREGLSISWQGQGEIGPHVDLLCSFQDGVVLDGILGSETDDPLRLTLLADSEGIWWLSTRRAEVIRLPPLPGGACLSVNIASCPAAEGESNRRAFFGAGIESDPAGPRLRMELAPAVFLLGAADPWQESDPESDQEIVTLTLETGARLRASSVDGRVERFDFVFGGESFTLGGAADGFAKRRAAIRKSLESKKTMDLGDTPFSRAIAWIADDLLTAAAMMGRTPADLEVSGARLWLQAFSRAILEPIERSVRPTPRAEVVFRLASEIQVETPSAVIFLRQVAARLYIEGQKHWSVDDWPLRLLGEAHGYLRGETPHFHRVLEELSKRGGMGPLGCLITARLLESIESPASRTFALAGHRCLTFPAFWSDVDVICQGGEKLGAAISKLERPESLVALLPESYRSETLSLVQQARQDATSHREVSRRLLALAWDPLLKPLLEGSLEEALGFRRDGVAERARALHAAVHESNVAALTTLLEAGGDVNAEQGGESLLQHAVRHDNAEVLEVLVQKKVVLDGKNKDGHTPLMLAAGGGWENSVRILLTAGVDVHQSGERSYTALHFAAEKGHPSVIALLLEGGARPNAKAEAYHGARPLHLACQFGHLSSAQALLDGGADPTGGDATVRSPLELAQKSGNPLLVELLTARLEK